jgi:two-component system nitrate/nitrite response regulator NarL
MQHDENLVSDNLTASVSTLIVSEVCFLRECLAKVLAGHPIIQVCGLSGSLAEALAAVGALRPAIVLLDVAFPGSFGTVAKFYSAVPDTCVVALAIAETEENVLAWADAGVAGYVPNTASVDDIVSLLQEISRGEQTCSSRISGSLLRRVATTGRRVAARAPSGSLTRRECEILRLVGDGLSNKDIARRLKISLGTTKSHVHNLLGKLNLQKRGETMRFCATLGAETRPISSGTSTLSRSSDL